MSTLPKVRAVLAVFVLMVFGAGARGADPHLHLVTLTTGDDVELSARYYPGENGRKSPAVLGLLS